MEEITAAETASQDSRVSSLRGTGDLLTTIQIPVEPPPQSPREASGLELIPNDLPMTLADGVIFTFTSHPSTGSDSISMSTASPGGDSLSSILTSPPTPRLTAHELALIGTKHTRNNTQKLESDGTPWFYSAMRSKIWRRASVTPTWAQKKNGSKELIVWFFVVLVVVILLAVVVPVSLVLEGNDDKDTSLTTILMSSTTQKLTTTSAQSGDVTHLDYTTSSSTTDYHEHVTS